MKTHIIVLAGGTGKRMGNNAIPKQFLNIGSKPIIIHTLQHIIESKLFDSIYVVIHKDWSEQLKKILSENGWDTRLFRFVIGGKERIDSIENALIALKEEAAPQDVVLIHDGVRPFITTDLLTRCIETTKQHSAAISVIPAKDTFVSMQAGIPTGIIDRKTLFHTQTPAGFQFSTIYDAINRLTPSERLFLTGIVQICQIKKLPVHAYPGEEYNFKITTSLDLALAEAFLKYTPKPLDIISA